MTRGCKGEAATLLVVLLAGFAGGFVASGWKPLQFLKPKPPITELTKAQDELARAKADALAREAALTAAQEAERAKTKEQVQAAQQSNEGTLAALERAPVTKETKLAKSMAVRTAIRLTAAIGELPAGQRNEILAIVDQALSDAQDEIDRANAALAEKDAAFAAVTAEKQAIAAQIPALQTEAAQARAAVETRERIVADRDAALKHWAAKKDEAERHARSLSAQIDRLWRWALYLAAAYAFLAYVLPGLLKHMDDSRLKRALRDVSGFTLNPLLYLDAKKKLTAP